MAGGQDRLGAPIYTYRPTMLLLDAFNILHAGDELPEHLHDIELPDLIWLIGRSRYAGIALTVVCDGVRPGAGHAGPAAATIGEARVLYAGGGREADDEIERFLRDTSFANRLLVVSSDKRIQRATRQRKARWMRSSTFLRQIAHDLGRQKREPLPKWVHEIPLGPEAVRHWLDEFGLPEDWALIDGDARASAEAATDRPSSPPSVRGDRSGHTPRGSALPHGRASDGRDAATIERAAGEAPEDAAGSESESTPPPAVELDDRTRELMDEHAIDPEDLDMRRWFGEA